jgi:transaldolase
MHIIESAKLGAHVVTCPPAVIRQLYSHPLTDKGLAAFVEDWKKTGQSIL